MAETRLLLQVVFIIKTTMHGFTSKTCSSLSAAPSFSDYTLLRIKKASLYAISTFNHYFGYHFIITYSIKTYLSREKTLSIECYISSKVLPGVAILLPPTEQPTQYHPSHPALPHWTTASKLPTTATATPPPTHHSCQLLKTPTHTLAQPST